MSKVLFAFSLRLKGDPRLRELLKISVGPAKNPINRYWFTAVDLEQPEP